MIQPARRCFFRKIARDTAQSHRVVGFTYAADSLHRGIDGSAFSMRFQTNVSRNSLLSVVFSGLVVAFLASSNEGGNIFGPENGVIVMRDELLHVGMFRYLR